MITKNSCKTIGVFVLIIYGFFIFQHAYAQQRINFGPNTQSLVVDLTEISSIPARSEVFDLLKSNNDIVIEPFENASKVILSSNVLSKIAIQQFYESIFQRITLKNETLSKVEQANSFNEFAAKYGYESVDKLLGTLSVTENNTCATSLPFCTDLTYDFPAGTSGSGESGPDYVCLYSTPAPAWYYMKIAIGGTLTIEMYSSPAHDIDFILWGPFDDPVAPCTGGLTADKKIDCSFSAASIEYCDIANGQVGKYYILLITNYSQLPCNITFHKSGGVGTTDCGIVPPPIGSNSPVCVGENILLTAETVTGATYHWTGPNGWTSTLQNPVIQNADFSDAGQYSLVITVGGSTSDPITTDVVVNALPIPAFSANDVCFGEVSQFTNQSTTNPAGQPITGYLWNFGDSQTSTLQNPTHTYTSPGSYNVTLTCYTGIGNCEQSVSHNVMVNTVPVPAFSAEDVCFGEATHFINQSTTNPPGGTIDSYLWNFGDGQTSALQSPVHTYASPGEYTVTLTCYVGTINCEQSVTQSVGVNTVPVPAFIAEDVCLGQVTHFTNQSTTNPPGQVITNYLWNFGDNQTSTSQNPTHTYASAGNYTVTLTCTIGETTCQESISHTVKVHAFPVANAGPDQSIPNGSSTSLNGSMSGGSGNLHFIWSPAQYLVNPNVLNPTTVNLSQTVVFTLSVSDQVSDCESSDQVIITVTGSLLSVEASANPATICYGESSQLNAYPSGGTGSYTYSWTSVPIGFTSTISNPMVTPTQTTTYTVSVFDGQTTVNASTTVTVRPLPVAHAGNDQTINVGTATTLQGSASGGGSGYGYLWSPADSLAYPGTGQHQQNPLTRLMHVPTTFTLIVDDNNGCISEPDQVTVFTEGEYLGVVASTNNNEICLGESTTITAIASGGSSNYSYHWTTDNSSWTSTLSSPTVSPQITTVYTVEVDDGFMNVTASVEITVHPVPVPAFTSEDVCFGEPTHFTNQSTTNPPGESITGYLWDFGDGQTSTLETPTHTYANPGNYLVTLTCYTGNSSCEQSVSHNVIAAEYPEANAGDDQSIADGWSTTLSGTMSGGSGNLQFEWSPAEYLVNPDVLNPTTVSLTQTVVFILAVTDQISGCSSTDEVMVNITGGELFAKATADPDNICSGANAQLFTYTSGGAGNYTYSWTSDPSGFTSNISNPIVAPLQNTTYTVSVFDGQVTYVSPVTINVKPVPIAVAGEDKSINVGTSTILHGLMYGGSGDYTYLWSPADSLANPSTGQYEQNPETKLLYDALHQTIFTLLINDDNGCVSEPDQVVITVGGSVLAVHSSSNDTDLCNGESTIISAAATGGSWVYTYHWTTDNSNWSSNLKEPEVSPSTTTVYTVVANDGFASVSSSIQVVVNSLPVVELKPLNIGWYSTDTINVCVRDSVWLDAGANMNYLWNNGADDRRVRALTNGLWVDFQTYSVEVTNPATGCQSSDIITIFFDFTACNLGIDDKSDMSESFNLKPNPTHGVFTIEVDNIIEDGTIGIVGVNGSIVEKRDILMVDLEPKTLTFDLTPYPNGVYLIWFSSKSYRAIKQIIKN
jgi:PKD repeat protein